MDKDLKILQDLKAQIERGRTNFKKAPKDRITDAYIRARIDGVEDLYQKFANQHQVIISTYSTKVLAEFEGGESDWYDEGYETYLLYKGELNAALKSVTPSPRETCASTSQGDTNIRSPKISIPLFNGNYADWSSFKDLFNSLIHDNPRLDDVQRLHYLKTQLRGEAEQLIKHIPITQGNYMKCWDMLQCRYDNKRFMSNCILRRLFGQRSMNSESAHALKELLDTTTDCLHELSNLGIKVDSWDVIIIYVVSLKLDPETRKQWELVINNSGEDLPSFRSFQSFLESRFRALEFVESGNNKHKFTNTNNAPKSTNTSSHTKVLHAASQPNSTATCPHCHGGHKLQSCSEFTKEEVPTRRSIVQDLKLCFNCLGSNHFGKVCWIKTKCQLCRGRHHTLLHGKPKSETQENVRERPPESSSEMNETTRLCSNHFATGQCQTLLATALVKAESRNGSQLILRALLDQGSQASFISEAAVQLLQLKKTTARSCISGLGDSRRGLISKSIVMVDIQSLRDPTFKRQVKAHVLKSVTAVLPERKFTQPEWTELSRLQLADPQYSTPNKIDILLGSEVYCEILKQGLIRSPDGATIAQDTYFGWILSGRVGGHSKCFHNFIVNLHLRLEEDEVLKKFWVLESEPSSGKRKILSPEEHACEDHFKATTRRDKEGRYIVELPFRPNERKDYGDTRDIAVRRLMSLEKRLAKSPEQKQEYSQVLRECLSLGHMEEVKMNTEQERV